MDHYQKIADKKQLHNDDLKERHNEINLKNSQEYNNKIDKVLKKEDKYTKIYEDAKKEMEIKQAQNVVKNNLGEVIKRQPEPKGVFYDPMPSISTNKGFTFGLKNEPKVINPDNPKFPTFLDDFEKLILKNQKNQLRDELRLKHIGPRFPEVKTDEVGDSRGQMKIKQEEFEKKRNIYRKELNQGFFIDRQSKRESVDENKKRIQEEKEENLRNQIIKQYKTDSNYLIKDINYSQVENATPSYSMLGRYEIGSIFQQDNQLKNDKQDDFYQAGFNTLMNPSGGTKSMMNFEEPNFALIRPRYPAISFGNSKRFDLNLNNFNSTDGKLINRNSYSNTDISDSLKNKPIGFSFYCNPDCQSFLRAQTTMGTDIKLYTRPNGNTGPDMYKIKGFADEVTEKGEIRNQAGIRMKEIAKQDEIEKEKRDKLIEQRREEKKLLLKLSLRETTFNKFNDNANDNNKEQVDNEINKADDNTDDKDNKEENL